MKLIVGLGNIGDKYCFTRHNAGFMVLDKWALDNNISFREEKKLKCFIAKMGDNLLIKPTTFMNLSGEPQCYHSRKDFLVYSNKSKVVTGIQA